MDRATKARLEYQLDLANKLSGAPIGDYPTPGRLDFNHDGSGWSVGLVVNHGGGIADMSPYGLTASQMLAWLRGFNTALDLPRKRQHWGI
jgi:TRAP-type mannitol/chloroaromatic compound transport system substrate-binding protein